MLPVLLSLLSAVCFAFGNVVMQRGLSGLDHFTGLLVNLTINSVLLWLYLAASSAPIELWVPVNLVFAGVGLLVPGVSRLCVIHGIQRMGASVTSTATSAAPLFAIVFALFFLNERPTPTNLVGALLIVGGIVLISWRGEHRSWRGRDLGFPLTAAFLFALRDNLVRFGLLLTRSPVLAAAIASTSSALTFGAAYAARRALPRWTPSTGSGLLWFAASGVANFFAYVFMYTALGLDRISIVSPLVNSFPVFVLPLAYFLLKGIEEVTARTVGATVSVVLGVLLISWEKF